MMRKEEAVLLFEDDPESGKAIEAALRRSLKGIARVIRFNPKRLTSRLPEAYEDRLEKELRGQPYRGADFRTHCDRDLSRTTSYSGLSEAVVSRVAARLAIPICIYARGFEVAFGNAR